MNTSLTAKRILVTRPSAQADNLCHLIEHAGGKPWRFPTLEINPEQPDQAGLKKALNADWLIFTSSNAVDFAIRALNGKMPGFVHTQVAAVGSATAKSLQDSGWPVHCVPASEFSSEGLLAEQALQSVSGLDCVIVRGVGGRDKLEQGLSARGAKVTYLEVYRRQRPQADSQQLISAIMAQQLDAISITSTEALDNLLAMLDTGSIKLIKNMDLVVASQRIADKARQLGFKYITASQKPSDNEIVETLKTLYNGEHSGRSN